MEDLLQSQIKDSCRLALPEGLHDLMSDISREVLRAQPKNLLKFITDYLSALLVTRENIKTSASICDNVCEDTYAMRLDEELRSRGIEENDIKVINKLVDKHFMQPNEGKPVKEGNLISKIFKKTSVPADKVLDIQEAIRKAFVCHQAYNTTIYELTPDNSIDDATRAARHTLYLFRKTKPTEQKYHMAAEKIEAAYRAYGVRRHKITETNRTEWEYAPEILNRVGLEATNDIDNAADKSPHITFIDKDYPSTDNADTESRYADSHSIATDVSEKTEDMYFCTNKMITVSSTSLAGSYIHLPRNKPYTVHCDYIQESEESDTEETREKQKEGHLNIDYTKQDSIVITEPLEMVKDYEPDNFESESSVDEMKSKVSITSTVDDNCSIENVINDKDGSCTIYQDGNVVIDEDENVIIDEDEIVVIGGDENVVIVEDENVVNDEDENVIDEDENVVIDEDENILVDEDENVVIDEDGCSIENIVIDENDDKHPDIFNTKYKE